MVPPSIVVKDGMDGRRFARSFSRSAAIERLVNAIFVVVISELFQLSLQVDCVPDEHAIEKLSSYRWVGSCVITIKKPRELAGKSV
jgi:hypothetical protein